MEYMQTVSRLIEQFIPEHYQISLDIKRTDRTFKGTATINGVSPADTGKIMLHSKDLTIESVTIDGKKADFGIGEDDELSITHPDILKGHHVAVIGFSGTITDAMHGLYPCYYEHEGNKKELLATQFESHHAREVLPCIDEPEAKATFDVTLTTEPEVTVLSNMPIKNQSTENNRLVTSFETTPRMSTYLLAWVIGEMHRKTATTKGGVEVNVWATPAQPAENLDFALDHAVRTIDFFDDYFGVAYPLPKSDHVALPDFSSGAMENWGLITYREIALLASPTSGSISSKQYIALVVAHELSHQWFGNLVTMKWWNNLWLNESFATLMEYIAVDALHPEWDTWLDFSTQETILALRRDAIDGVQPVQTEVKHPDEIGTLFDGAIVYAKGARLLRMLQQYIGHEAFQAGLKAYFASHAYRNTDGDDLWKALSEASGKDIGKFMSTWISQPGYPVVQVTRENNKVRLHQEQFFIGAHETSDKLWPIPLNASTSDLPTILETAETTASYSNPAPLRLNVGDTAHFLTKYDETLFMELVGKVESSPPLDRLQLLHEQTLLARGGAVTTASLVPLLDAYKNESNEAVWDIIGLAVSELKKFVETDKASEEELHKLAKDLARNQYERLGWTMKQGEEESETKLRAGIIGLMLYGEDPDAIKTALELYRSTALEDLDPELRPLIISAVVRYGGDDSIVTKLIQAYKSANSAEIKDDIASGMTSTRSVANIHELLEAMQDNTIVRAQDVTHWFVWLIRNRDGRAAAWQWLQNNWSWINRTFGSDKSYDDFPRYAATALVTRKQLDEYRDFFTPMQQEPALARVITLGLNEIKARVELLERDGDAVRDALAKL
jgi:aminopeptidase N